MPRLRAFGWMLFAAGVLLAVAWELKLITKEPPVETPPPATAQPQPGMITATATVYVPLWPLEIGVLLLIASTVVIARCPAKSATKTES